MKTDLQLNFPLKVILSLIRHVTSKIFAWLYLEKGVDDQKWNNDIMSIKRAAFVHFEKRAFHIFAESQSPTLLSIMMDRGEKIIMDSFQQWVYYLVFLHLQRT